MVLPLTDRIIRAFAEGLDGLSDADCERLVNDGVVNETQCERIQEVVSRGLTDSEKQELRKVGLSKDIISGLSQRALHSRVRWLGQHFREEAREQLASSDLAPLTELLQVRRCDVRLEVLSIIYRLGGKASPAIPAVIAASRDLVCPAGIRPGGLDRLEQAKASLCLIEMEPARIEEVPDLIQLLKDGDWRVKTNAAKALGEIGSDAYDAIPYLTAIRDNETEHERVRDSAEEALQKISTI